MRSPRSCREGQGATPRISFCAGCAMGSFQTHGCLGCELDDMHADVTRFVILKG